MRARRRAGRKIEGGRVGEQEGSCDWPRTSPRSSTQDCNFSAMTETKGHGQVGLFQPTVRPHRSKLTRRHRAAGVRRRAPRRPEPGHLQRNRDWLGGGPAPVQAPRMVLSLADRGGNLYGNASTLARCTGAIWSCSAGGVSVAVVPFDFVSCTQNRALAQTRRCRTLLGAPSGLGAVLSCIGDVIQSCLDSFPPFG